MPYLGRPVTNAGQFEIIDDISSGFDGSETSFTLQVGGTDIQPDVANVTITLGGVFQVPSSAYSITGSAINFSEAPESNTTFHGVLAGQSQFIESDFITNTMIKSTANISGSKIDTDFSAQSFQLTNVTASGDISGSSSSTFSGGTSTFTSYGGNVSGSSTSTGSFGKVEVGSGKITTTGNMVLDADGAQIRFEDGGTEFGRISRVSSDLVIKSISNNNDILFKGVDGSSTITALQLDMSEAGNAIFNNDVTIAGTLTAQEFHTEFTSASIVFSSGSTIFGDTTDDTHLFSGSVSIHNGEVGVAAGGSADELVIKNNGDAGISVLSPDGNSSRIQFGSVSDNDIGHIGGYYNSGNEYLFFSVDGSARMVIGGATNAGNVGIGTNNPTVALEVFGSADQQIRIDSTGNRAQLQFDGKKTSDAEFAEINFANDGDSAAAIHAMRDGANDAARLAFFTQPTGGSVTERMSIDSSGFVGIGTASPAAHLEVVGGTDYSQIQLTDTDTDNTVQRTGILSQHYDSDEQAIRMIGMYSSDTTSNVQIGGGSGDHNSATLVQFFTAANTTTTAGTLRMIVSSSGHVGIGTDSPDNNLHIYNGDSGGSSHSNAILTVENNGRTAIQLLSPAANDQYIFFGDNSASNRAWISYDHNASPNLMTFQHYSDSGDFAFSNGSVGIHTTSPNVGGYSSERGVLTIGSTDNGSANNYANLELQGHAIADNVTVGDISFLDHTNQNAIVRGGRDSSSTTGFLSFFTNGGSGVAERMRIDSSGHLMIGRTSTSFNNDGSLINPGSFYYLERSSGTANSLLYLHRRNGDGKLINFYESNTEEGYISVSGATVSLTGFQGAHQATGIPDDTPTGTVVSTIDEEFKYRHANVKISDTVGDTRVYGVVENFRPEQTDDTGNTQPAQFNIAGIGVGHIRVTGSCAGGDLLESNGDGLAKVQDDDIIRSKTIGKVTANVSGSATEDRLVACVLYCG